MQLLLPLLMGRSSHQRCSIKKVFLEISQNSQENTYARVSFLITLQAWDLFLQNTSDGCFLIGSVLQAALHYNNSVILGSDLLK